MLLMGHLAEAKLDYYSRGGSVEMYKPLERAIKEIGGEGKWGVYLSELKNSSPKRRSELLSKLVDEARGPLRPEFEHIVGHRFGPCSNARSRFLREGRAG
jgi:hypothetical protein